jgi:uncharacterized repeat protein (TIGR03803 family)
LALDRAREAPPTPAPAVSRSPQAYEENHMKIPSRHPGSSTVASVALAVAALAAARPAAAQTLTVLHSFAVGTADGNSPRAGVILDPAGNLYGTTYQGGAHNRGIVFALSPTGGGWSESVLWHFGMPADGTYPAAGLVRDASGVLWGVTSAGGAVTSAACPPGCGAFFRLANVAGTGTWAELPLFSFPGGAAGYWPIDQGSLFQDASGNFYGTTERGGANGLGAVFKMTVGGGATIETVLYGFDASAAHPDGTTPQGAMVMDSNGILYGTTSRGGITAACNHTGCGTVFALLPPVPPSTAWTEQLLWRFGGAATLDGAFPSGGLILDAAGNLYGTTQTGGSHNLGTVFELSPVGGGVWFQSRTYHFAGGDGATPVANLIMDGSGNLYGTTQFGGASGHGTVFKLVPTAGTWNETILHSFTGGVADGANPTGNVIMDAAGNLYGTTTSGGAHGNYGTVFQITP